MQQSIKESFTGAASALFSNQPNVTRTMKKLEDELGCPLFIQQRHGIALTPEGEKLYAHISAAFEHILCGEEEIARDRSLESGIITVAASEIALHCVLLPALKEFRTSYPGVRIRVLSQSTPQAIGSIKKGLADLAVITEPVSYHEGLNSRILRSIQEVPVCFLPPFPKNTDHLGAVNKISCHLPRGANQLLPFLFRFFS